MLIFSFVFWLFFLCFPDFSVFCFLALRAPIFWLIFSFLAAPLLLIFVVFPCFFVFLVHSALFALIFGLIFSRFLAALLLIFSLFWFFFCFGTSCPAFMALRFPRLLLFWHAVLVFFKLFNIEFSLYYSWFGCSNDLTQLEPICYPRKSRKKSRENQEKSWIVFEMKNMNEDRRWRTFLMPYINIFLMFSAFLLSMRRICV